ncbi:MAG: hypothetical protein Q4C91_18115, partial [Eubacteriales bacterium]|nr:hypothetical protein [Eubacteriales bacterium]
MKQDIVDIKAEQAVMKQDIVDIKAEISDIKAEQAVMKQDIVDIKAEISDIKAEQAVMKQDISDIKAEQRSLRLLVENDIRKQINIVAEGHFFIQKHFNEMHEMYVRYESLAINVQSLNSDMREVKRRLSMA